VKPARAGGASLPAVEIGDGYDHRAARGQPSVNALSAAPGSSTCSSACQSVTASARPAQTSIVSSVPRATLVPRG